MTAAGRPGTVADGSPPPPAGEKAVITPTEPGRNTEIAVRAYQLLDRGDLEALGSIYAEDVGMITPDEHIHGIEAALSLLGAAGWTSMPCAAHLFAGAEGGGRGGPAEASLPDGEEVS